MSLAINAPTVFRVSLSQYFGYVAVEQIVLLIIGAHSTLNTNPSSGATYPFLRGVDGVDGAVLRDQAGISSGFNLDRISANLAEKQATEASNTKSAQRINIEKKERGILVMKHVSE